jgi:hypothetical protein
MSKESKAQKEPGETIPCGAVDLLRERKEERSALAYQGEVSKGRR